MAEKKRGLGAKGLGINALINTEVQDLKTAKSNETVTELDLDLIEPSRDVFLKRTPWRSWRHP